MGIWQLQAAKTHLGELIEEAHSKGPQIITRHGTERAVVISPPEYRRLMKQHGSPATDLESWILGGPKLEDDDPFFEALIRHPEPGRDLEP